MGKVRDLTNQRFGTLVALNIVETKANRSAKWLCQCDCGNTHIAATDKLVTNQITRCSSCRSMNHKRDLTDQIFGKLTAKISVGKNKYGQYKWECLCECGELHTTLGTSLISGSVSQCRRCSISKTNNGEKVGEIRPTWWSSHVIMRARGHNKSGAIPKPKEYDLTIQYGWDLFLSQNRKCALSLSLIHI
jgi:hypothetical protein